MEMMFPSWYNGLTFTEVTVACCGLYWRCAGQCLRLGQIKAVEDLFHRLEDITGNSRQRWRRAILFSSSRPLHIPREVGSDSRSPAFRSNFQYQTTPAEVSSIS